MIKLITKPSENQLFKLYNWLRDEYIANQDGFFCNWNVIEKSFSNKQLFLGELNSEIVAFVAFSDFEDYVECDIFNVRIDSRGKNIGRKFYQLFEEFFENNRLAIKLFCSPEESEPFWIKMGFLKLIYIGFSQHHLSYYKPIKNHLILSDGTNELEGQILLWNCEPNIASFEKPQWQWSFNEESDFQFEPILIPANCNWQIEIIYKDESIVKDKVKYMSKETNKYYKSPFLFIYENPVKVDREYENPQN